MFLLRKNVSVIWKVQPWMIVQELPTMLFRNVHLRDATRVTLRYMWNTTIQLRDVPFERKCKCHSKGTTMKEFSNLPTLFFINIQLRDAILVTLRDMLSKTMLIWEMFLLRETISIMWEGETWVLFHIYKLVHLDISISKKPDRLLREICKKPKDSVIDFHLRENVYLT